MYRIKDLRDDHDLPQRAVAELLHISQQQYSKLERGVSEVTARELIILARFYHVSVDYILGLTKDPRPSRKE